MSQKSNALPSYSMPLLLGCGLPALTVLVLAAVAVWPRIDPSPAARAIVACEQALLDRFGATLTGTFTSTATDGLPVVVSGTAEATTGLGETFPMRFQCTVQSEVVTIDFPTV